MQLEGSMLIGYQPMRTKNLVNFFRIIIINARTTLDDLDKVIDMIDQYGRDLWKYCSIAIMSFLELWWKSTKIMYKMNSIQYVRFISKCVFNILLFMPEPCRVF